MAKIIIIGGGAAGLSAGIYAQDLGHEAVIYESHTAAGGNLTGWERGGYGIDNCLHWLTGTNEKTKAYKMWRRLGVLEDAKIYSADSLYCCEYGGERLSLCRSLDQLRGDMKRISPRDSKRIDSFVSAVRAIQFLQGFEKRGASGVALLPFYLKTTAGELAASFYSPLIRTFLSSFLSERIGSLALLFVFANFCAGNADLPAGGSKAAAERMAEEFVRSGGTLRAGRRVLRLEHDGATARSVVLSDGTTDEADHFIIATDPFSSYRALTGRPLPRALRKMSEDRRLFTFSSVHCAFSCPADPPFRGELMLPLPDAARGVYGADSIALREFSHEKGCAPDGETVVQAFVFCDKKATDAYLYKYRDKKAYAAEKERFAALAEETITTRFPSLCGRLGLLDVWTPATYERYTGSGSYMSFAFGAGYIPHRAGCRADGFDNVFLATQWLTPPGGLPNAAYAGKAAAEKINALCIKRSVRHVSAQGKADTV